MRLSHRTRFTVASVAAVATFALAACGGDDDDSTDATEAPIDSAAVDPTVETVVDPTDSVGGSETTTDATTDGTEGGGEVGARDDYVEAITAEIEEDMEDPSQAECFAEALVSDDVYAAIEEQGLTVEEFGAGPSSLDIDQAQAETIAGDLAGCGELADQFGGSETETTCLTENLDNEQLALLVTLAAFELQPTDELLAAQDDVSACVAAATTTTT